MRRLIYKEFSCRIHGDHCHSDISEETYTRDRLPPIFEWRPIDTRTECSKATSRQLHVCDIIRDRQWVCRKSVWGGGLQIPPNIRAEADARRLIIGPLKSMQLLDSSLRYRNCYLKLLMCDSKNNIWGMRYNFLLTFNEEMEQDDPYGRHWTACY